MSNVKEREDGLYLVKLKSGRLDIIELKNLPSGVVCAKVLGAGEDYYVDQDIEDDNDYSWISDKPLDLESIRLLMMNGGLENAVKVVHKDSMYNIVP